MSSADAGNYILQEVLGGILLISLNRPAKKNALTTSMYEQICDALARAAQSEEIFCVVLDAYGDDYCAGNDILDFVQNSAGQNSAGQNSAGTADIENTAVFRFLKAITFFEKPLIAAVQGQAVGVGTTMLLHCDLVIACENIRLSVPFLQLGLTPEAGSSRILPGLIGHRRAFEWLALGGVITAETAKTWGIVNKILPREALLPEAMAMAQNLARLSPRALRHTKALMRDPQALWAHIVQEGVIFQQQLQSQEAMTAFSAFMRRA
jgi:enoyl-CoA hydratase/carnithine racemase